MCLVTGCTRSRVPRYTSYLNYPGTSNVCMYLFPPRLICTSTCCTTTTELMNHSSNYLDLIYRLLAGYNTHKP